MTSIHNVLRRPIVTEKSNYQNTSLHQYVFEVMPRATKAMVKDAVENMFDVEVINVRVLNVPAKQSRRARSRRIAVRKTAYKKAVVTLRPEDTIDIFEGVK